MKKIYLLRHGESQWNLSGKIQGQKDIPLTNKGISQAKLAGDKLSSVKIDKVYSSDLSRAYDTAKIIGDKIKKEPITVKDFREISFGTWEGLSNKDIATHKEQIYLWRNEPENLQIPGGENLGQVQSRAIKALNQILQDKANNNILLVSHGVTLKTLVLGLLNMDLKHFKNLTINNVGLSIIEFRDYNKVLKLFNDTSHLKETL